MNNLILLRHGQSQWNLENRFTGWKDVSLTDKGITEAMTAGRLMRKNNIKIDLIYTSILQRAYKTAEFAIKEMNLDYMWKNNELIMTKSKSLNERDYGDLVSLNKEETANKYGKEQVQIWRRSFDIPPPKMDSNHPYKNKINTNILGESLKDTFNRVVPYYNKKIEPLISSKKNILIVFHGNSCRALLMKIFNISKEKITKLEIPTANPLLIRFEENLKVKDYRYLDKQRARSLLFND